MTKKFTYDFPRPAVTVDIIVVTRGPKPKVLLIRRKHDPFAGCWAIPGGFVEMDETLEAAARRELKEETGVSVDRLEQLHAFGDPGRDPRGRTIAVAYWTRVHENRVKPHADDDAAEVGWFPLHRPPVLAFDHREMLGYVRRRLKEENRRAR
jgi:8-oxo-dGTP diphosphatase